MALRGVKVEVTHRGNMRRSQKVYPYIWINLSGNSRADVCKIVEGQWYSKRLNELQITAFLKVTCQRAQGREKDIMQTVVHNAYYEDPYAKEFGIKISDKLAQVEARMLSPHGEGLLAPKSG
ncbi:hypothetical protein MKW92_000561 [Papaver armeniacum]|nr:hypothetical protein MKW92_000561 [Papaver armeniacum]